MKKLYKRERYLHQRHTEVCNAIMKHKQNQAQQQPFSSTTSTSFMMVCRQLQVLTCTHFVSMEKHKLSCCQICIILGFMLNNLCLHCRPEYKKIPLCNDLFENIAVLSMNSLKPLGKKKVFSVGFSFVGFFGVFIIFKIFKQVCTSNIKRMWNLQYYKNQ